jgi:hypothetical protein
MLLCSGQKGFSFQIISHTHYFGLSHAISSHTYSIKFIVAGVVLIFITFTDPQINITILPEQFESDGVVVTLEWTRDSYLYNISGVPGPLLETGYGGFTRIAFNVSYNTHYSVNVTTAPLCGLKLISNTAIMLHYGN